MALLKMSDFGPDSGGRVKVNNKFLNPAQLFYLNNFQGVTEVKPIVYGNISRAFGKKRDEDGHTHG